MSMSVVLMGRCRLRMCVIRAVLFSCVDVEHVPILHDVVRFVGSEGKYMVFRCASISILSLRYRMSRFAMCL